MIFFYCICPAHLVPFHNRTACCIILQASSKRPYRLALSTRLKSQRLSLRSRCSEAPSVSYIRAPTGDINCKECQDRLKESPVSRSLLGLQATVCLERCVTRSERQMSTEMRGRSEGWGTNGSGLAEKPIRCWSMKVTELAL